MKGHATRGECPHSFARALVFHSLFYCSLACSISGKVALIGTSSERKHATFLSTLPVAVRGSKTLHA